MLDEFDGFRSWFDAENKYYKKHKRYPAFDDEYIFVNDKELLQLAFFFYYSYYRFGLDFLRFKIRTKKYSRKDNIIQLVNLCQDMIHEVILEDYENRFFAFINDKEVEEVIKKYAPITEVSIKEYILSDNLNLRLKAKTLGYMIVILYQMSSIPVFSGFFFVIFLEFYSGKKFDELFEFISEKNVSLYKNIRVVKKYISIGLHALGYFDYYEPESEENGFVSYIEKNFYNVKASTAILNDNEISWKYVTFLNGELQIYNPKHPDGQGKYKPFYYKTEKSIKAFNQIKENIINKLPPIKAIFKDGIIVSIDPSSLDGIDSTLEVLTRHTGNIVHLLSSHKSKHNAIFKNSDYSNEDVYEYISSNKSEFLSYLFQLHLSDYKIYYCMENRVNSEFVKTEEDAFIFTLVNNGKETLLAYENAEDNRATYLFVCDTFTIEESLKSIAKYFSSGLVNKRESLMYNINHQNIEGINRLFKISHLDNNWMQSIADMIKELEY